MDTLTLPELSRLDEEDLRPLLLIRHFEAKLLDLFAQGKLNGTTHTCLGQEYIPVALEPLLHEGDFVFSNHRGHGHYLSRYRDPAGLLAEIMGREGAVCNGVGGSQHILRERYLSTGIQGQGLPVAVGVALKFKRSEPGQLVCAYVGDGTWGEGSVYEALNMAQLWQVPLLVVVENNGIAQSTPTHVQMSGTIAARAAAFGVAHHRTESFDVNEIRTELAAEIEHVRSGRPLVVEFVTNRVGPHSKGDDARTPDEVEHARRLDWYRRYAETYPEQVGPLDDEIKQMVDQVADDVVSRPLSRWENR